ncbi:MAG TPA: restriction endonuclease subunit S [Nannocystaceae bacterium]|nr:restriction endonuclease subunit S [Nannocystaceae bacterium]
MSELEWPELTLDDVKAPGPNALAGGPFGSDLVSSDYLGEGVPVIRGSNFADDERREIVGPFVYVSPAKAAALARSQARPGDVVFTQRGTVGQVAVIPRDLPHDTYVISQSQMKVTCDPARVLPEYVYYWFRSPRILDHIDRHTIATGVPHTNLGILRRTPIVVPPLAEQAAIVGALSAFDGRIVALRALAGAADALIHELFHAHFVACDAPGVSRPGEPWPTRPLLDLADFVNGTAFRGEDFTGEGVGRPVIKIGELRRGLGPQTRWSATGGRTPRPIADGDVLFAWSGNPDTSIGTFVWGGGEAWLNQHIFKIEPRAPEDRIFLYALLRGLQGELVEIARNHQTTGLGHVPKRDLRRLSVPLPTSDARRAFHEACAPLYAAQVHAQAEIDALARARDALLPELLAGSVRVGART